MFYFFFSGHRLMVRTLVFQSSNVGSIPAGPIMYSSFHKNVNLLKTTNNSFLSNNNIITYNFTFISLIAPFLLNNLRLSTISSNLTPSRKTKLLIKQSYLILTWFYYLTISTTQTKKDLNSLTFSFLPLRSKSYTLTKAPMAQKTRSKEQFHFKFYVFKVSVHTKLINEYSLYSLDQTLLAFLVTKSVFPVFETNLLLLKNYILNLRFYDNNFFNYHTFLLNCFSKRHK